MRTAENLGRFKLNFQLCGHTATPATRRPLITQPQIPHNRRHLDNSPRASITSNTPYAPPQITTGPFGTLDIHVPAVVAAGGFSPFRMIDRR